MKLRDEELPSNDELWESMIKFIESEKDEIKNRDGRIGKIIEDSSNFIISREGQQYIYHNDTLLIEVVHDGWLFV